MQYFLAVGISSFLLPHWDVVTITMLFPASYFSIALTETILQTSSDNHTVVKTTITYMYFCSVMSFNINKGTPFLSNYHKLLDATKSGDVMCGHSQNVCGQYTDTIYRLTLTTCDTHKCTYMYNSHNCVSLLHLDH